MKIINFGLNILLALVIFGVVAFLLAPRFGMLTPFELKIVRSGSMEPAISTGSVVLIQPTTDYKVGDVITFGDDTRTSVPTTHRIVSTRTDGATTYFETKGDANEDVDPSETPASKIIGRVAYSLPYAGYILAFSKTQLGFALLVLIPAALIICYEAIGITQEVKLILRRRRRNGQAELVAEMIPEPVRENRYRFDLEKREVARRFSVLKFDIEMPAKMI